MTDRPLPLYDIVIEEADGTQTGFMLVKAEGRKLWQTSYASMLAAQMFTDEATYNALPPEQELVIHQDTWHAGFGKKYFYEEMGSFESENIDDRFKDMIILAPKPIEARVSGGWDGIPACAIEYKNEWYVAAGKKLYKWGGTDFGAVYTFDADITHLHVYGDYLLVAQGSDTNYYYSSDGEDFTQATPDESNAQRFTKSQGILFKFLLPNLVSSTDNPTQDTNPWEIPDTEYGDSSSDIVTMLGYDGCLYVLKTDGSIFERSPHGYITEVSPSFHFPQKFDNFVNTRVWRETLYMPAGYNGLYEYYGWIPINISPSTYAPKVRKYAGQIQAMAGDTDWLYVFVQMVGEAHCMLFATRYEDIGGKEDYRWHPLCKLQPDAIMFSEIQWPVDGNPRLWFGGTYYGAPYVGYVVLPKQYADIQADPNCLFQSSGYLITSYYDAHFPSIEKALFNLQLASEQLSSITGRTITAEYQFMGETAWHSLAEYDTSPFQEEALPVGTHTKQVRFKYTFRSATATGSGIKLGQWILGASVLGGGVPISAVLTASTLTGRLESKELKEIQCTVKCVDHCLLKDGKTKDEKTATQIVDTLDRIKDSEYPVKIWPYISSTPIYVDLKSPSPAEIMVREEPKGNYETAIQLNFIQARVGG